MGPVVSTRSPCALHLHELQTLPEPFDVAFVAGKSSDTVGATWLAHLRPDGGVVNSQNGMNDERVAAVAGRECTLGCGIGFTPERQHLQP